MTTPEASEPKCASCGGEHRQRTGAICGGQNQMFVARIQDEPRRRYQIIGKPTKCYGVAIRRMAAEFAVRHPYRGDVIMTAEYYDPVQLCELIRS